MTVIIFKSTGKVFKTVRVIEDGEKSVYNDSFPDFLYISLSDLSQSTHGCMKGSWNKLI